MRSGGNSLEMPGDLSWPKALGLGVDDIFPIRYDIRQWVSGAVTDAVIGTVDAEPVERLSRTELIDLAL